MGKRAENKHKKRWYWWSILLRNSETGSKPEIDRRIWSRATTSVRRLVEEESGSTMQVPNSVADGPLLAPQRVSRTS